MYVSLNDVINAAVPLAEIEMPRMSDDEIADIIVKRLNRAGMKIGEEAVWNSIFICKGLPHIAHLLGLHAMQTACDRKSLSVEEIDIDDAVSRALSDSNQSIREGFEQAVYSERTVNIFSQVLVACSLSNKDRMGRFTGKAVAEILTEIMGEPYDVPAFAYHLNEFCGDNRGPIMEKFGEQKQFRYRFIDTLMEPYILHLRRR